MMSEAIKKFPEQFLYTPTLVGTLDHHKYSRFIVIGMGGSHLAADALKEIRPDLSLEIHSDYGLPSIAEADKATTLVILSSYSGNTEEVLEAGHLAVAARVAVAAVAVGGALLRFATEHEIPFVQLPDTGIQPRSAWGFSLLALMKLVGLETDLASMPAVASALNMTELQAQGQTLAAQLQGRVPVIYSTTAHYSIAYNWKIKFNETAKIPAFCNRIPELNHNEMNGFDTIPATAALSDKFVFVFLTSESDHPQNKKRFAVLQKLYTDRHLPVITVPLSGKNAYDQMARALALADWTAVGLSELYGTESEQVPMVEEFKRLIA